MTEPTTINDVMSLLDKVPSRIGLARAGMWGAHRGTAPADRWDYARADLKAAADFLAAAMDALAAMDKQEPYCTLCGEILLNYSDGWTHVTADLVAADHDHRPAMNWRALGTPGKREQMCPACGIQAADSDMGICWECAEGAEASDA